VGINDSETFEMLAVAFGEQTVWRTQIFEWFVNFKSYVTSIEDAQHMGHSSTKKVNERVVW